MRAAYVAARHEEVVEVPRVGRGEGYVVKVGFPRLPARAFVGGVEPLCGVVVERPAADRYGVVKVAPLALDVVLGEDFFSDYAVGVAPARNHADGFERDVLDALVLAAVFHVVPDAHDDCEKLETQHFVVAYGVVDAAELNPPVAVVQPVAADVPELHKLRSHLFRPRRRSKRHRLVVLAHRYHEGRALAGSDFVVVGERLPEFFGAVAPAHDLRAGLHGKPRVPRGVHENFRLYPVNVARGVGAHPDRLHLPPVGLGAVEGGVEHQGEIGLGDALVV